VKTRGIPHNSETDGEVIAKEVEGTALCRHALWVILKYFTWILPRCNGLSISSEVGASDYRTLEVELGMCREAGELDRVSDAGKIRMLDRTNELSSIDGVEPVRSVVAGAKFPVVVATGPLQTDFGFQNWHDATVNPIRRCLGSARGDVN